MKTTIQFAEVQPITKPIEATVRVPGSKSYSLRALLISALCQQPFDIKNLLDSEDTQAMQRCLRALKENQQNIDVNESGLTARFMTVLACIKSNEQIIDGSASLRKRPIKDLVDALRDLGAKIEYLDKDGYLPLRIISSHLPGNKVTLKGSVSSQYLSALLLISPSFKDGLEIEIIGKQISKPYIDMTIDIMAHFGVIVDNKNYKKYTVKPQQYRAKDYIVESDYSAAGYFFAIERLTGSKIKVEGLSPTSKQADKKLFDLLQSTRSLPYAIDVTDFPDQAMTLAALAAFRPGKTMLNGVASLRVKETERVAALQNELTKMGIRTTSTPDSLTIYGGQPKPAYIDTYGDHRLAMSFAVAATKISGIRIINSQVVNKTFPGFWDELRKITEVNIDQESFSNILLIGMRGSGKSTIGKKLSKQLGMDFIDMDKYIEEKYGQKVRDIVTARGWDYFRDIESKTCQELSKLNNSVISSGGGIILRDKNMSVFRANSINVLLKSNPRLLSTRIKNDKNRPELSNQPTLIGELGQVWKERKSQYFAHADFVVNANLPPRKVVNEIIEKLEQL